jgi:hypothetical protein
MPIAELQFGCTGKIRNCLEKYTNMKHYFQAAIITCPELHVSSLLHRHCGPTVMRNLVYHAYYNGLQFHPYRMTSIR